MKKNTPAITVLACVAVVILSGFDSCSPPLIQNSSFDIWCGDVLCGWEVEQGEIARVSTWHKRDYGVELIGNPVVISQLDQDSDHVQCITFDMLADAEEGVDLVLEVDFLDDGDVEYSNPIPADNWHHVHYDLAAPEWYHGVRYRVRKTGPGRAVLAHLRPVAGVMGEDCTTDQPKILRPHGAPCDSDDQCDLGVCTLVEAVSSYAEWQPVEEVCSGCADDGDCPSGQACGMEYGVEPWMFRTCGEPGRHALGEHCVSDAECATDLCCAGQCSECCPGGPPCPDGLDCARRTTDQGDASYLVMPHMCAPGEGLRVTGEPCMSDGDCDSGQCEEEETLRICDPDGRRCDVNEDCPWYGFGAYCVALGALDGVCL